MNYRLLLRILLVISILYATLEGIGSLLFIFVKDIDMGLPEELATTYELLADAPNTYFIGLFLLYLLETVGALMMWRLKAIGFHFYTTSRLLLILLPMLFLDRAFTNFGDIMMAFLYIIVYWMLLKQLGAFSPKNQQSLAPEEHTDTD